MIRKNEHRNKKAFCKRTLASLCLISVSFAFSSCALFKKYQHVVTELNQPDVVFEDANNNVYFDCGFRISSSFRKYTNNQAFQYNKWDYKFFYEGDQTINYQFSASNSKFLFTCLELGYVSPESPWAAFSKRFIRIFDKEFNVFKTLPFSSVECVRDISCSENYLYICLENEEIKKVSLYKYDYINDLLVLLDDNIKDGDFYKDDDIYLFFKEYRTILTKSRIIGKYTNKTRLLDSGLKFYTDKIKLEITKKQLLIDYEGVNRAFDKGYAFTNLYRKVYLIDNQIVFAAYNNSPTALCDSENRGKCICGLQESYLFKYDLLTNDLSLIKRFDAGTFLVDYDLTSFKYYYDGGLYVDDALQRECKKIEPEILEEGQRANPTEHHFYYLSFYNGSFYGI